MEFRGMETQVSLLLTLDFCSHRRAGRDPGVSSTFPPSMWPGVGVLSAETSNGTHYIKSCLSQGWVGQTALMRGLVHMSTLSESLESWQEKRPSRSLSLGLSTRDRRRQ